MIAEIATAGIAITEITNDESWALPGEHPSWKASVCHASCHLRFVGAERRCKNVAGQARRSTEARLHPVVELQDWSDRYNTHSSRERYRPPVPAKTGFRMKPRAPDRKRTERCARHEQKQCVTTSYVDNSVSRYGITLRYPVETRPGRVARVRIYAACNPLCDAI